MSPSPALLWCIESQGRYPRPCFLSLYIVPVFPFIWGAFQASSYGILGWGERLLHEGRTLPVIKQRMMSDAHLSAHDDCKRKHATLPKIFHSRVPLE